jgi:putative ABC transport system permease protein
MMASNAVLCLQVNSLVKFGSNSAPNTSIMAVSSEYDEIRSFEIAQGRYLSPFELQSGRNAAVIGHELANELFQGISPVGQIVKVGGRNVEIVGVFLKEGKSAIGENSHDNLVLIPINYAKSFVDFRRVGLWIMVKASQGVSTIDLNDELRGILRTVRKLKPIDDDNFALNEISLLKQGVDKIFGMIDLAGIFIGGLSILVGGFGIANIMFVSVKERTSIIGIQKALGAKNYFILIQFLYESVLLSVLGGLIGLLLIFIFTLVASAIADSTITLTFTNIVIGLGISAITGVVFGFLPAWSASRLSPVEAINTKA